MFWCFSCQSHTHNPVSCNCCHSPAIQQITHSNNPKDFTPYLIQTQTQNTQKQDQNQEYFSFQSLYRNAYRNFFDTISERRIQAVRTQNTDGTVRLVYMIGVDTSEQDKVRGLTSEEINQLEVRTIEKQCTVCQESNQQEGYVLGCQHEFHKQCLLPWIEENGTCPTCRFKLVQNS